MTGEVQKAIFTVGRAVINMNGTYQSEAGPKYRDQPEGQR